MFGQLILRGTETEEQIQKRLRGAKQELERAKDITLFDHILVNANLDQAYEDLKVRILQPYSQIYEPRLVCVAIGSATSAN